MTEETVKNHPQAEIEDDDELAAAGAHQSPEASSSKIAKAESETSPSPLAKAPSIPAENMPAPEVDTIPEENMPDKEYQPSQDGDNMEGEVAAASNAPAVTNE